MHLRFHCLGLIVMASLLTSTTSSADGSGRNSCKNILQFTVPDLLNNKPINFCEHYAGKVLLIVNTASKCAFTGQYEGLEKLYSEYRDQGLVVLGFPSNQFANQEPGTPEQIQNFCRLTYGVQFPMFAKSNVKKQGADPIWQYLGDSTGTYPKWNFYKYLINREGEVVEVFSSITSPDSSRMKKAIKALL